MNRFYVATMIGIGLTMVLALRVIMIRAPRSAGPPLLARLRFDFARLRSDFEWVLRAAKGRIDDWIAASLARRERDAVIFMPHDRRAHELSAKHGDRGCIDGRRSEQDCVPRMTDRSVVCATGENRR